MGCGPSRSAEALTPSADASSRTVTTPAAAAPTAKSPPPAAAAAACCYKPDSEAARLQSLLDCHQLDTPAERRFDAITSLLKDLLEVPVAVVGLIDDNRLYLKSTAGDAQPGASHDRLHSFCDASLRAPNPRMMVVPDTLEDARFKHNEFTKAGIRSYTGAPLVTSEGFVVGSLGVMDIKPRAFPPSALNILCNFAELVVRELERDKALERQRQAELAAVHAKSVRALTCFNDAVCFCDASAEGWPIRWANEKWDMLTGWHDSEGGSQGSAQLWDVLSALHPEVKRQATQAAIFNQTVSITTPALKAGGRELALELRPASRDHLSLLAPTIAVPNFVEGLDPAEQPALDRLYFIVARPAAAVSPFNPPAAAPTQPAIAPSPFKPPLALPQIAVAPSPSKPPPELAASGAAAGGSAGHALPDGLPASPPSLSRDHPARGMLGSASSAGGSSITSSGGSSVRTLSRFGLQPPAALASIQLGPKLGSGSYGHVYRGTMGSQAVAVKIIDTYVDPGAATPTKAMLEALLRQVPTLQHRSIVRTLTFAWEESSPDPYEWGSGSQWGQSQGHYSAVTDPASLASLDSPLLSSADGGNISGRQIQQMWIVQEYCDRGTLGDAIDRGWLRVRRDPDAPIDLRAVLLTAQEIAQALSYLHAQGIIHSDLTPNNVLLTRQQPQPGDPRPFHTKVSDFGLSRTVEQEAVNTVSCGCITHMPLELISQQLLTRAVDAYSFGVICVEMLSGERAWAGRHAAQILYAITTEQQRLHVPPGCPPALRELVESCLQADHTQRPSFRVIDAQLAALLDACA